jgi:hypothetical protein
MPQLTFDESLAGAPPAAEPAELEMTPEGRAACARIAELFADQVGEAEARRVDDAREREARRRAELLAQLAALDD